MRFGVGISTCREGLTYPSDFLDLQANVQLAKAAENLGFHSLWANDHFATQRSVADILPEPPNFYEPLIAFSYIAGQTSTIRLVIATIVAPLRDPVLLAKQAATLDHASHGRLTLGLGIGAYREEFEAIRNPAPKTNRGRMMEEQAQALRALFTQRRTAFTSKYYQFAEIEVYPKPIQNPFPIYLSGNTPDGIRRTAKYADGWIAGASPSPDRLKNSVELLRESAIEAGRDPADIEVTVQLRIAIGYSADDANTALSESQHFRRLCSTKPDEDPRDLARNFAQRDLMGTPEELVERIRAYRDAGADHLGLIFLANNSSELFERVDLFGRKVIPAFQS